MLRDVRRPLILAAAAVLATSACGGTIKAPRTRLTAKQMVEQSKPGIVRIEVFGPEGRAIGTGFAVARDGRIATNLHVIAGAAHAKVVLYDGSVYPVTAVVAVDEAHDLAIIRIERLDMVVLKIGDSDDVSAGDPVYAIGNPLGADYTISDGLISAVRSDGEHTVLQISAPISLGSSGGPLLNRYGEVIGVATAASATGQNLNFGTPSNYLQPLLATTAGESFETFARRTKIALRRTKIALRIEAWPRPRRVKRIPEHPVSYLDGCTDENIRVVAEQIVAAIDKGAPIYNGTCIEIQDEKERRRAMWTGRCAPPDHEACFRIYEGTALRLENELPSDCQGAREALGQGLLRAQTLETYGKKAWAMRDAFDGLLAVIVERIRE